MPCRNTLLLALAVALLPSARVLAQPVCTLAQITDSTDGDSWDPSLDGGSVAFVSDADLTGGNPNRNPEIFLYDGSAIRQITESARNRISQYPSLDEGSIAFVSEGGLIGDIYDPGNNIYLYDGSTIRQITQDAFGVRPPSLDRGTIAFVTSADLTGENPAGLPHLFLYDGSRFQQISEADLHAFSIPSLDGGAIAFASSSDPTGGNPDGGQEIFLYDGSELTQITDSLFHNLAYSPSLDGSAIAFTSNADLTGGNPASFEIFLYDGAEINQITDAPVFMNSEYPSLDGRAIAFLSDANHTGENQDERDEVFLFDGSTIVQVTHSEYPTDHPSGPARFTPPSLDGGAIAFASNGDLTGGNPDGNWELFLATCPELAPPPGPYLTSDEIPDFRFKVRITAGNRVAAGIQESDCLGESLCVSAALPGRSELFVRLIGPRPNGFLWTNLVRFTPSRVEVWAEQISTGKINYYDLPALPRENTELTGLVDKEAFLLAASSGLMEPSIRAHSLGLSGMAPLDLGPPDSASVFEPTTPPQSASHVGESPKATTFTSEVFPGYGFTVRISSGNEEQPVQVESDCLPETICVSGALPGRSELFLRIIGPRPNGFLWTNLVRFTTSRVEVEIEQLATGDIKTYVLDEVPRQSDQLPGRVDKEAFLP